jgi:hypothetical protein
MSVLAIEHTTIDGNDVTVTAVVDEMRLLYRATHLDPEEYAPALCQAYFTADQGEQIPTDENGFCQYLDSLNLDWQLLPVEND